MAYAFMAIGSAAQLPSKGVYIPRVLIHWERRRYAEILGLVYCMWWRVCVTAMEVVQ